MHLDILEQPLGDFVHDCCCQDENDTQDDRFEEEGPLSRQESKDHVYRSEKEDESCYEAKARYHNS